MKSLLALCVLIFAIGCDKPTEPTVKPGSPTPVSHIDSLNRTYHLKDLKQVKLQANGHDINSWVMDDEGKRREGMMWLDADSVKDDDSMIFVFEKAEPQSFWMKDTILALDIIYISADKKVLNIQEGEPQNEAPLPSAGPALYVLEMKQGSAKRLGIKAGTAITIPDSIKIK